MNKNHTLITLATVIAVSGCTNSPAFNGLDYPLYPGDSITFSSNQHNISCVQENLKDASVFSKTNHTYIQIDFNHTTSDNKLTAKYTPETRNPIDYTEGKIWVNTSKLEHCESTETTKQTTKEEVTSQTQEIDLTQQERDLTQFKTPIEGYNKLTIPKGQITLEEHNHTFRNLREFTLKPKDTVSISHKTSITPENQTLKYQLKSRNCKPTLWIEWYRQSGEKKYIKSCENILILRS